MDEVGRRGMVRFGTSLEISCAFARVHSGVTLRVQKIMPLARSPYIITKDDCILNLKSTIKSTKSRSSNYVHKGM